MTDQPGPADLAAMREQISQYAAATIAKVNGYIESGAIPPQIAPPVRALADLLLEIIAGMAATGIQLEELAGILNNPDPRELGAILRHRLTPAQCAILAATVLGVDIDP